MRFLIIGAGLGGLSAAISIKIEAPGHEVVVIEAAAELTEIGAGLQLTPNATRALLRWGLGETLAPRVAAPETFSIYRYNDAKLLGHRTAFAQEMKEKYCAPFWDCHRADLQRSMFGRAKELGVEFRFGDAVVEHDFSCPAVLLRSGKRVEGDLIVGADGLWSRTRENLLGSALKPIPTGDVAYRIVLETDRVSDPELRSFVSTPRVCMWVGPDCHAIYYPLKNNTVCNIVLLVPDNLPPDVRRASGDIDEMKNIFASWEPRLQNFLSHVDAIDKWKLMHLEELSTWHNSEGTVVLIGDSCHPMLPYMAQGAGSSIEDGALLGLLLSKVSSRTDVPGTLKTFEAIRKPRSVALQKGSMKQRHVNHLPEGPEQAARDEKAVREMENPGPEYPFYWLNPADQAVVYGYDIFEAAEASDAV